MVRGLCVLGRRPAAHGRAGRFQAGAELPDHDQPHEHQPRRRVWRGVFVVVLSHLRSLDVARPGVPVLDDIHQSAQRPPARRHAPDCDDQLRPFALRARGDAGYFLHEQSVFHRRPGRRDGRPPLRQCAQGQSRHVRLHAHSQRRLPARHAVHLHPRHRAGVRKTAARLHGVAQTARGTRRRPRRGTA